MRRGTKARIACWSATVIVLIVLMVPGISMGMSMMKGEAPMTIGCQSVYDLDSMTECTLL